MVSPHSQLMKVTKRVIERSKPTRHAYLSRIDQAQGKFPARGALSCANLAHGFAGMEGNDKLVIKQIRQPNIMVAHSPSVGWRFVTTLKSRGLPRSLLRSCTSKPPTTDRTSSNESEPMPSFAIIRRRFFLRAKMVSASWL